MEQNGTNNMELIPNQNNSIVTLGDWVVTILLLAIPIVNIVMLCVWAFGSTAPISKKNFAKAQLIFMGIGIVLLILFWGSIVAILASAAY